jgi:hypothetical protein
MTKKATKKQRPDQYVANIRNKYVLTIAQEYPELPRADIAMIFGISRQRVDSIINRGTEEGGKECQEN